VANPKLEVLTTPGRIVYAAGFWGALGCSWFAF